MALGGTLSTKIPHNKHNQDPLSNIKKKKPFLTSTALKKNPNTHTHTHNCLNLILILDLHLFKQKPYVVDIKGR